MSHAGISHKCAQCHAAGLSFAGMWTTQPLKQLPAVGSAGGHVAIDGADCGSCHSPTVFTSFTMPHDGHFAAGHGALAGERQCLFELP